MSNDAFTFARIAGGAAKGAGRRLASNPHKRGALLWHCWRVGFLRMPASVSGETISRGTKAAADKGRAEWTSAEKHLLLRCMQAGMGLELASEIVGRSYAATRIQACRMAKRAA